MDLFISWSGKRSGAAAEALYDWLPKIINALKPWLSASDIEKGARWSTEIASKLKDSKAGIICLTPSNLHSDWLLFEAGALSKTIENTYVCPFLIGLEPVDVKPPLAQFQATRATKPEVLKLLKTLNTALGDAALPTSHIDEAFDVWWPKLESRLKNLPSDEHGAQPSRSERDLLEEILALVRGLNREPGKVATYPTPGKATLSWADPIPSKVKEAILSIDPEIATAKVHRGDRIYGLEITRNDGSTYKVEFPADFPVEAMTESIKRQIPARVKAEMPEKL